MDETQRDAMILEIRDSLAENTRKTEQILKAFPGDDTEGHRRYHQAIIERLEQRNRIVQSCLEKAAQAGVIAGMGWVLLAIYNYAKLGLHT